MQVTQDTIEELKNGLIDAIHEFVSDETILHAFQGVPRHEFVPVFLERIVPNKNEWRRISCTENEAEWLKKIYTNQPLVTSVDQDNYPNCSSSQPDLMAQMLQSIKLHHGDRVLEIGSGTGYNAALLSCLIGPENVVSVDVNDALLDVARARIERTLGWRAQILHADGRNLPDEFYNSFDAIIVTGAHERLEPCWIQALKPGGRIILNWIKSFARGIMLEAEKVENRLVGHVADYEGDFMGLHDGSGIERNLIPFQPLPPVKHLTFPFQLLREDQNFRFFLQINVPVCFSYFYKNPSIGKAYVLCDIENHRIAHFFADGSVHGDASLAKEIDAVARTFEQLDKPNRQAFSFVADTTGQMIFSYQEHTYCVRGLVGHY